MAKAEVQKYKARQMKALPTQIGVYALCDLDETPIYVGQSTDSIAARVRRHLTSARSDVIANRQIDVWEIAFVWAWPVKGKDMMDRLEAHLITKFNLKSPLVNAKIPDDSTHPPSRIPKRTRIQVMPDNVIVARRELMLRFPRQIQHFNQLVDYILNTQDKPHLRSALRVYFDRLSLYYEQFLAESRASKSFIGNEEASINES